MSTRGALDALINLAIAYIVMSISASSLIELLSQFLRVRGRVLGNTIRGLLGDKTNVFYALPTIRGLRQIGSVRTWFRAPAALVAPKERAEGFLTQRAPAFEAGKADPAIDFVDAQTFALAIGAMDAQDKLPDDLTGAHSPFRWQGGQLQTDLVKQWFEQAMRATTRQYRRTAQLALFLVGLVMASAVGLDSVRVLYDAFAGAQTPAPVTEGWSAVPGYVMTAAAIALGAQYWFDVVGKLLGLRSQAQSAGVWGRAAQRP